MSSSTPEDSQPIRDTETARLSAAALEAQHLATAVLSGDRTAAIPDEAVQQLLTAGIRLFAAKVELERRYFSPLTSSDAVTATDTATLVTELLRAVNLNLFDLSMWAARPRDGDDAPR